MMSEAFDVLRLIAVISVLASACLSDLRTREVSDVHWAVLGAFGIACMAYTAYDGGMTAEHVMMIAGSAMVLISVLYDVERNRLVTAAYYGIMAALFIIPCVTAFDDPAVRQFLTVPATFLLFLAFYYTGIVKGGADVKCLIVLQMVFQTFPAFLGFPLIAIPSSDVTLLLPFSVMVLFHACLVMMVLPFYFAAVNISRGDRRFPVMLFGRRMDIGDAEASHVWPLEKVDDGNVVVTLKAQERKTLDALRSAGAEKVWVTPMVPFLIPITAAVVFIALIGNLLFIPFSV